MVESTLVARLVALRLHVRELQEKREALDREGLPLPVPELAPALFELASLEEEANDLIQAERTYRKLLTLGEDGFLHKKELERAIRGLWQVAEGSSSRKSRLPRRARR